MRKKRARTKLLWQTALLLLLSAGTAKAGSVLEVVGEHPLSPPLASAEAVRQMVLELGEGIREGMDETGDGHLHDVVKAYLEAHADQVRQVEYRPGQFFRWMLYRHSKNGVVHAEQNVTWTGEAMPPLFQFSESKDGIRYVVRAVKEIDWHGDTLPAFEFSVVSNGRRYVFAVPLCCGNLALKEVVADVPNAASAASAVPMEHVQVSSQPVQQAVVVHEPTPTEVQTEIVYVDREVKVPVEVVKYVERTVPVEVIKYVDRTVLVDRPAAKRPAAKRQSVAKQPRRAKEASSFHFVSDVGYLRQSDPADYGLGRIGFEHAFNPYVSFLALGGGAVKASGTDGEDAFLLDFLVQLNLLHCPSWPMFYVGIGAGAWMTSGDDELKDQDSGGDAIANVGIRLFGQPDGFSTDLFLEARAGLDEMDQLSEYGRFGGGVRLRF